MVHLFFKPNEEKPPENQAKKLNELLSRLETYNLIAHDNETGRTEGLQAILDHLDTMKLTPSLREWVEHDLIAHLNYYGLTKNLDENVNVLTPKN